LKRLQDQREYTLPKSHEIRLNQVIRSNNSVAAFLQSSDKVRPSINKDDTVDVRAIFDHYVFYMKEVSKGWSVSYERFKQMLDELGYSVRPYIDGVGVHREEATGLRLVNPLQNMKP
jgi:putative DNA primase/helicase